ncbi:MAG: hypothetical protein J5830_04610 [Clostridia bacterium]|nr:hypothetical protein [Clostridia bacterium]
MKNKLSIALALIILAATVLASCSGSGETKAPAANQELVNEAAELVYEYNKPGEDNSVASSFTLPSKIIDYEGVDLDVTWELEGGNGLVSLADGGEGKTNVKVDPYADEDTNFSLKGTVSSGEFKSDPFTFNYVIKQFLISNWQYWSENVKDVTMNIRGVIVARYPYAPDYKNTSVMLQDLDNEHGYMAYRLKCDSQEAFDTDLAIGNVIVVSGKTSIYSGLREMGAGCTYSLVYGDDGKVQTREVTKISLDDILQPENNLVSLLDPHQGQIGVLTGAKITKIEWAKNSPETFEELGDGRITVTVEKNGVAFKMFLSTSCTYTVAELKEDYQKLGVGYTIDVEGAIAWNNEPQLYPVPGKITVVSTEVAASDKIANELNALSIPEFVSKDESINLPVTGFTYEDVSIAWALGESSSAVIADDKLNVTVGKSIENFKITATATCGDATDTREFSVSVIPADLTVGDILDALYALDKNTLPGTYTLTGKITEINTEYSSEFDNVTVTIVVEGFEDKPVQCFRMKGEGAADLKVGDVITVTGVLKDYKGTKEFDAGCTFVPYDESGNDQPGGDAAKILDDLYALAPDEKLEGTYTLSGTITKVNTPYDAGYDNVTVTIVVDGFDDKPVQCFRMKGTGADTIKVGDKITVSGVLKNFNGTKEFDAACTLDSIDFVSEDTSPEYATNEELLKALYALELGDSLAGGPYTLKGVISTVDTPYDAGYDNVTVTIVVDGLTDYPVLCYRLKGEGADKIKVGDTITVKGQLVNYNSKGTATYEFTSGCTLESIG